MFNKLKISQKFILSFIIITIGPLLTVAYLSYSNSKYQLESKIVDGFSALNNARAANINYLLQLRLEQARELAGTFLTRQLATDGNNEPWIVHKMQGHVDSVFNELKLSPESPYRNIDKPTGIESIGLIDIHGKIIVNTDRDLISMTLPKDYIPMVKRSGTFFAGFNRHPRSYKDLLVVLDEVRHWETGTFAGAILLSIRGDVLNDITTDRTGLGETGETYIVNRDGYIITNSRFIPNAPFRLRVETPASRSCFMGLQGPSLYHSYHETSVLGVTTYMPDQDWCMVSEMDTLEAFTSVYDLRDRMSLLIGIVILLILLFMSVMNDIFIKPIVDLRNAAYQVSEGKLDVNVKAKSKDELGELTEEFNNMVVSIREDKDKLEVQKQDLQKVNKELDSFVYTASHDLRAPLRGIASFATFLEEDYEKKLDEEGLDHLREIRQGADRLSALIDDLLTLSRISRIKNPYKETDIGKIISDVKDQLKYDIKDMKVDISTPKDLPHIVCDPIKIKTVFLNLVNNALKFSGKKENVLPKVEIGYNVNSNAHEFSVKDNGIGIDPEFHDKIFGLFRKLHTAKEYDGTGAGLSIVQRIVEDHGGSIWVESQEGEGATFYFTIPKTLVPSAQENKED